LSESENIEQTVPQNKRENMQLVSIFRSSRSSVDKFLLLYSFEFLVIRCR